MTTSNTQRTTKVCGNCAFYVTTRDTQETGECLTDPPVLVDVDAPRRMGNRWVSMQPTVPASRPACRHWQLLEWRNLEG